MQGDSTGSILGMDEEEHWGVHAAKEVSMGVVIYLVVFGGVTPYYLQYREILRTQNSKGFSLYVCLTLLVANILRILFWWGRRFELPLLFQSVVMIVCMLAMIEVSVRVQRKEVLPPRQLRSIWNGDFISHFWNWTDFGSYVVVTILFTLLMAIVTRSFLSWPLYIEAIGFAALFSEANLATPQLWTNYVRKSTAGMSIGMVLMWLVGDVTKTIYFLLRDTPAQFWLCGIFQIVIDIVILLQVRVYRRYGNANSTASATGLKPSKSDTLVG